MAYFVITRKHFYICKICFQFFENNPSCIRHQNQRFNMIYLMLLLVQFNFQIKINIEQLMNLDVVMSMISAYLIFRLFKNIRGTPQCFHNMFLYVLAKVETVCSTYLLFNIYYKRILNGLRLYRLLLINMRKL